MSATLDEFGRPDPPLAADEATSLVAFLEFHRATIDWKCRGLDAAGLAARLAPSAMSLGGMLKHLAKVEDLWCSVRLHGNDPAALWNSVDWNRHPDWEWETAAHDAPDQLRAMWQEAVDRSRALVSQALASGGLDQRTVWMDDWYQEPPTLRWVLLHLNREYARHVGHADLLRESIDGLTGE